MDSKKKQFIINGLRRMSYRWPGRYKALKASHIGRNEYFCASCGVIHGRKEGALDHIEPVVNPEKGWEGFDIYIERMFVEESGWQRLCNRCHDEKTDKENAIRKETKKKT